MVSFGGDAARQLNTSLGGAAGWQVRIAPGTAGRLDRILAGEDAAWCRAIGSPSVTPADAFVESTGGIATHHP
jgi:hypothetical protein